MGLRAGGDPEDRGARRGGRNFGPVLLGAAAALFVPPVGTALLFFIGAAFGIEPRGASESAYPIITLAILTWSLGASVGLALYSGRAKTMTWRGCTTAGTLGAIAAAATATAVLYALYATGLDLGDAVTLAFYAAVVGAVSALAFWLIVRRRAFA